MKILMEFKIGKQEVVIYSDPSPPKAAHISAISAERLIKEFGRNANKKNLKK